MTTDKQSAEKAQHVHEWAHRQNVTTKGCAMPPYEACRCGAARPVEPESKAGDDEQAVWEFARQFARTSGDSPHCGCISCRALRAVQRVDSTPGRPSEANDGE